MDQRSTPSSCLPLLLLLVALPLLFSLVYFGLVGVSFESLGLTRIGALLLLLASLAGGMINVPLNRRRLVLDDPRNEQLPSWLRWMLPYVHYYRKLERRALGLQPADEWRPLDNKSSLCDTAY